MKTSPILQRFNQPFPALLVVCCFLFFFRLGVPGLTDPDEGRYAEIAREMLVLHDYLTPHLNFLPYLEKPPLVYWFTALSLRLGGLNEWAARAVPALSALGGVLAVYWLGARLWGPRTALLAGLVTATSSGYFLLARLLLLDTSLTCFLTWAIGLAYVAVRNQERRCLPWAYLALGLAVLTKGPVGAVLPALIFLAWFLARKQWRGLFQLWHPGGALLLAVVVLPWYLLVGWQHPDFWRYFIWHEHIQRFLTPQIHAGEPVYFYLGVLLAGFLPWVFLLPWAWRAALPASPTPEAYQDRLFLVIWFGVIFLFFSLARSKLFPYLLPGLPPLAMLVGRALAHTPSFPEVNRLSWQWAVRSWLFLALVFLSLGLVVLLFLPSLWLKISFLGPYPFLYSLILLLAAVLLLALPVPERRPPLLLGSALLLSLVLLFAWERTAEIRSPRPLAQSINDHWQADAVIVGFQYYSQALSFYTRQPLYLFQIQGELAYGLEQRPGSPYYLHWPWQLPELLADRQNFFVILKPDNFSFFQKLYNGPITVSEPWRNFLLIRNS